METGDVHKSWIKIKEKKSKVRKGMRVLLGKKLKKLII